MIQISHLVNHYYYNGMLHSYLPYIVTPFAVYGLYKLLCKMIPGPHNQSKLILKNRTVLITGASSGLARSIDKLQDLCSQLEEMGRLKGWNNEHKPVFRYLDVTELNCSHTDSYPQIEDLKQLSIDGKTIDVLVNNAGASNRGSCRRTPLSIHRQIMEVNFFGHIAVTRALIDSIPDDGAIMTISSLQGKFPVPYRCAYSSSKQALQAFFDCLRSEERPNLQILVVIAGYMNTGFGSRALDISGRPMGQEDINQLKGLDPDVAAKHCVKALENRQTELYLASLKHCFPIIMRVFMPRLLWWIMHKRAERELNIINVKSD